MSQIGLGIVFTSEARAVDGCNKLLGNIVFLDMLIKRRN